MKSSVISAIILAATAALISLNAFFVSSKLEKTIQELEQLPSTPDESQVYVIKTESEKILNVWKKNSFFLSLSINASELRDCTVALCNVSDFADSQSLSDYRAARSESLYRLKNLKRRETVSLSTVF